jgi:glycosyltransferase involved in cell wall biosynthesis
VDEKPNSTRLGPLLGLPVDDPAPAAAVPSPSLLAEAALQLTVIVPARNEALNLPSCLNSLLAQNDAFFQLDKDWELLIVDDHSTDATRTLAAQAAATPGVRLLDAPALDPQLFTGKNNACWFAAQHSRGRWLLFTDADTIHEPSDLLHALHEAPKHHAALLSYSPRQILTGFWQHALMPLIFSELASVYPPSQVSDPSNRLAAANGQFLLIERSAYFAVGGHRSLGNAVLEDVELARRIKRSQRDLRFRYAPDALSARMYRGFGDMVEGWTKNLALLFPHALQLAAWRTLDIALLLLPLLILVFPFWLLWQKAAILLLWLRTLIRFYNRVRRSNMSFVDTLISPIALPLFIALLLRSWMNHNLFHRVTWKGRDYKPSR